MLWLLTKTATSFFMIRYSLDYVVFLILKALVATIRQEILTGKSISQTMERS